MSVPVGEASPIRDVSYRNYDGPLRKRPRWWIVAVAGIRIAFGRWYFWVFLALAMLPYLMGGFWIFLEDMGRKQLQRAAMENPMAPMPAPEITPFALHFFQAAQGQGWWLLGLALSIGAASIAADMRANALLVYLSKPLTRLDYLFGKWMGIFVPLYAVSVVPAVLLYLYCFISYHADGFFKDEPYLIARVVCAALVPAMIHASLLLGCSAVSRSGRIAGAAYAGMYFLANVIILILWAILYRGRPNQGVLMRSLSIEGMIGGLQQNIYHVVVKFGGMSGRRGTMVNLEIHPPEFWIVGAAALGVCLVAMYVAWSRIRAVEVVRG